MLIILPLCFPSLQARMDTTHLLFSLTLQRFWYLALVFNTTLESRCICHIMLHNSPQAWASVRCHPLTSSSVSDCFVLLSLYWTFCLNSHFFLLFWNHFITRHLCLIERIFPNFITDTATISLNCCQITMQSVSYNILFDALPLLERIT